MIEKGLGADKEGKSWLKVVVTARLRASMQIGLAFSATIGLVDVVKSLSEEVSYLEEKESRRQVLVTTQWLGVRKR